MRVLGPLLGETTERCRALSYYKLRLMTKAPQVHLHCVTCALFPRHALIRSPQPPKHTATVRCVQEHKYACDAHVLLRKANNTLNDQLLSLFVHKPPPKKTEKRGKRGRTRYRLYKKEQ